MADLGLRVMMSSTRLTLRLSCNTKSLHSFHLFDDHGGRSKVAVVCSLVVFILAGCVFSYIENWDFTTTVYYMIITLTTVSQATFLFSPLLLHALPCPFQLIFRCTDWVRRCLSSGEKYYPPHGRKISHIQRDRLIGMFDMNYLVDVTKGADCMVL